MLEYYVYVHINKINNKIYVGSTKNIEKRWECNGVHYKTSTRFYNAVKKYGWDNFEHEIIASHLTKEEAYNFEDILIKKLNTQNEKFGYNVASGGNKWYGKDNPNYGNKSLSLIYSKNKEYSKEKQSRPRKQNGRSIKTKLERLNDGLIKIFDCRIDAVDYLKENGIINKNYNVSSVCHYLKREQGYKGYKIYNI